MRKIFLPFYIFLITLFSCNREEIPIESITISGSYNIPSTKSQQYVNTGVKASLLVFQNNTFNNVTSPIELTAETGGILKPKFGLFLENGIYDFYSVSENSSTLSTISFTNSQSSPVVNNKDYILAYNKSHTINNSNKHIAITYQRLCSKLLIEITSDSDVSNLVINDIKFTMPNPSIIDLSEKIIIPSTKGALVSIPGSGLSRDIIILPSNQSKEIELYANLTINGENFTNKVFKANILSPNLPGVYYKINLRIRGNNDDALTSIESTSWEFKTVSDEI